MREFTEQEFVKLVQKAESDAANNIGGYKFRLALFALLGYLVIFAVLFSLLLLVGGTVGMAFVSTSFTLLLIKKKAIFVVLLAIWTFLRALWIKFDPPSGYEIKRKDFPELFAEIDGLTKELKALKIHQVILDDQLNAAVVQHPRFGILGGQKNTLFLGLQLLLSLSPEQMRSVLAHEFGHLSGNHSRFSGWIYRIRLTWQRIMQAFESSNSFGAKLMKRFFDWYAPKFSAYSFALARSNEYEADMVAAKLTSVDIAAKALVNVHATAPYIEQDFWQEIYKQADSTAEPPAQPFQALAQFLKNSPLSRQALIERINREMEVETHYADTHPSLKDRIGSFSDTSVDRLIPDKLEISAAEAWLGDNQETVMNHFNQGWQQAHNTGWQRRFEYVTQAKASLEQCKSEPVESLNDDQLWEYATSTAEFVNESSALPLFQAFQERHPDSVGAAYHLGKILISQNNQEGLKHLKIAFNSPNTLEDAARWGYDFFKQKGDDINAQRWWDEALVANEQHKSAYAERQHVTEEDDFERPSLNYSTLQALKSQLSAHKIVGAVWLARKVMRHNPDDPVYVIAFRPNRFYMNLNKVIADVAESLDVGLDVFVCSVWGDTKNVGREVKRQGVKIL